MKRTAWRLVSLVLCSALVSVVVLAQNPAPQTAQPKRAVRRVAKPVAQAPGRDWFSVSVVRVKPEMITEWQDLQKNVVNPALRKAGVKERGVFETAVFGASYEYVIVSPIASFAQYDEPMSPLRKALGDEAWRDYIAKSRRCVVSVQTFADQSRPDLSYMGRTASMTGPPKLAVVNAISVLPGRASAFESLVKSEILPVMKKADVLGYFMNQTVFGGDGNGYTSITFMDSFAELSKGSPFVRVLGPDGAARLFAKSAGLIAHQERSIARYNGDLSLAPAP